MRCLRLIDFNRNDLKIKHINRRRCGVLMPQPHGDGAFRNTANRNDVKIKHINRRGATVEEKRNFFEKTIIFI